MDSTLTFSDADRAYISRYFVRLESRPEQFPAPSYVLDDGGEYYPANYGECELDAARFKARLAAACAAESIAPLDAQEEWEAFMRGTYGICLRLATPENIARKSAMLQRIEDLTGAPQETNENWTRELREAVNELDALEMPFSPDYDRTRFGRPPTRDTHITAVRSRFPVSS